MNQQHSFLSPRSFAVIGLILLGYLVFDNWSKILFAQPFLDQEKLLAKAESNNIESFFETFGESVSVFANLSSVESGNGSITRDLDAFVQQWKDTNITGGLVLTDAQGITTINSNLLGIKDPGVSLVDRDYFLWAKENPTEKYFIGRPVVSRVGASKGNVVIPVAAPVEFNNVFKGVLVASTKLDFLTEHYIGRFNISEHNETHLVDSSGTILYSSKHASHTGDNISEIFVEPSFLDGRSFEKKFENALNNTEQGSMTVLFNHPETGKLSLEFIAYSKVNVGEQEWLLLVATPTSGLIRLDMSVFIRLITSLTLLVVIYLVYRGNIHNKRV